MPMNLRNRITRLLLGLALAFGLLGAAAVPVTVEAATLHPALAELAARSPTQTVSVIVQKADWSNQAAERVAGLGGTVTKDLHIINAFVAEMTAGATVELAKSDGVKWVSLDAP